MRTSGQVIMAGRRSISSIASFIFCSRLAAASAYRWLGIMLAWWENEFVLFKEEKYLISLHRLARAAVAVALEHLAFPLIQHNPDALARVQEPFDHDRH